MQYRVLSDKFPLVLDLCISSDDCDGGGGHLRNKSKYRFTVLYVHSLDHLVENNFKVMHSTKSNVKFTNVCILSYQ